MLQISNNVYCDELFKNINIPNKVMANPYRNYPFMIIKNFVPKRFLKSVITNLKYEQNDYEKAKVKKQDDKGFIKPSLKEGYRNTNIYELSENLKKDYMKKFFKYKPEMENFFNIALSSSSSIQALEYKKGFFYKRHADDSSEVVDKNGKLVGFTNVASNRKLTTVLFCSSYSDTCIEDNQFSGGELLFNYLYDENKENIKIKPTAGDMVVFPSNPYFTHEVLPVLDGYRLTLVQWHDAIIL